MTRRKAATPEGRVLAACLQLLKLRGVYAWRCNNVAVADRGVYRTFVGLRGVSDIQAVLPGGRAGFFECKSARGRLSEHQRAFLESARDQGAVAVVVRDVAILSAILDRLEREPDASIPIEWERTP